MTVSIPITMTPGFHIIILSPKRCHSLGSDRAAKQGALFVCAGPEIISAHR